MKPGDKVKISKCAMAWSPECADQTYLLIRESCGQALVCPVQSAANFDLSALYPVECCKECGREKPER